MLLYKYRHFDAQNYHIRILSKSELWFSSAKSFNDPFDTAITYNFDGIDTEIAEKWVRVAADRQLGDLSPREKEEFAIKRLNEIRNDPTHSERIRQQYIEDNYDKFGICSFAGSSDNLLLWAHYANNHTGFCVGLSVQDIDNKCELLVKDNILVYRLPVKYSENIPVVNFFEAMLDIDNNKHIDDFISTKSKHWEYEQEQRLVLWDNVNLAIPFGCETIREVILGCRISAENKKLILDICGRYLPHVEIFQAEKNHHKFALSLAWI